VLRNVVTVLKDSNKDQGEKEEQDEISKAMDQYYNNPAPQKGDDLFSAESLDKTDADENDLEVFDLEDLEDVTTLKKVESIPAWRRKFMKK